MFDQYSTEPVYNVKAIVTQTGVAAATLRAWERRYGVPAPPRTDSGYRLYSARDVAMIRWLKSQVDAGLSISHAIGLMQSQLRQSATMAAAVAHPIAYADEATAHTPASAIRFQQDLIAAADRFDETAAERAFGEAFSVYSVEDVCINVLQPMLTTIGTLWHTGQISVSVEHFASNLVRRKISSLIASSPAPVHERKFVAACAPTEQHELGLLVTTLFLRRQGYPVVYLGQDTPLKRMDEMLAETGANVLLLSASHIGTAAQLLAVIDGLAHHRKPNVVFAYGGRIFNMIPALRERIPASFVGDNAVDATQRLVQLANRPELANTQSTLPRVRSLTLLDTLRPRRPDIVSGCSRAISGNPFEFNSIAHKYERAMSTSLNLYQVLDAAVAFDHADLLEEPALWEWDSLNSDGVMTEQMRVCVGHFCQAVRHAMPIDTHMLVQPYLEKMQLAVAR